MINGQLKKVRVNMVCPSHDPSEDWILIIILLGQRGGTDEHAVVYHIHDEEMVGPTDMIREREDRVPALDGFFKVFDVLGLLFDLYPTEQRLDPFPRHNVPMALRRGLHSLFGAWLDYVVALIALHFRSVPDILYHTPTATALPPY